jgi:phosphoglycolate phosphatase
MKPYQNIIFDLDGTISNSEPGILNALKYALKQMDVTIAEDYDLSRFIGPPIHDCFKEHFFEDETDIAKAIHHFRVYYADKGWSENYIYDGMFALLQDLNQKGYTLFIATNKPQVFTDLILQHFNITKFFKLIKGVDIDNHHHTKAELIKEILECDYDINAANSIMIGDSKWDIYAADFLNVKTIGVSWGFGGTTAELHAFGAIKVANTVDELRSFLIA